MRKFLLRIEELDNASAVAIADLDENQITSVVADRTTNPSEDIWNALMNAVAMIHQKVAPSLQVLPEITEAPVFISEPDSTTDSSPEDSA